MSDPYSHLTKQIRDDLAEIARLQAENEALRALCVRVYQGLATIKGYVQDDRGFVYDLAVGGLKEIEREFAALSATAPEPS